MDFRVCLPSEAYPNIKAGKTRGLAIAYGKRLSDLPDVPTFKELGLMELIPPLSYDFWGPPNLPPNLVNLISKAVERALRDPEYLEFCKKIIYQPIFKDAPALKEDIRIFEEQVGPKLAASYQK